MSSTIVADSHSKATVATISRVLSRSCFKEDSLGEVRTIVRGFPKESILCHTGSSYDSHVIAFSSNSITITLEMVHLGRGHIAHNAGLLPRNGVRGSIVCTTVIDQTAVNTVVQETVIRLGTGNQVQGVTARGKGRPQKGGAGTRRTGNGRSLQSGLCPFRSSFVSANVNHQSR